MTVRLMNFEGEWSIPNGLSNFEDIRPGMLIRWKHSSAADAQWTGKIREIREIFDQYGNAYVDLICDGTLASLAAVNLQPVPTVLWPDDTQPDVAFDRVLDAAQWPTGSAWREYRTAFTYAHELEAYDVNGQNVLDVLRRIAYAEGGAVVESKTGAVRFEYHTWLTETIGAAIDYEIESDGTGDIDLRSLGPAVRSHERIINAVTLRRASDPDGPGRSSLDPGSIQRFGRREITRSDVIVNYDIMLETLADRIINYKAFPQREIRRVTLRPATATETTDVMALDLGDVIRVRYEHPTEGWSWTVDSNLVGVAHDFTRQGQWTVTLFLDSTWQET